ncbi:MAG: hypothetical protein IPP89_19095 [Saprospiraceae bacterium]|nr:hypothetical protein [Candidatus Brachybacter algidus]MBL0121010.1 hypothetical protein [Candidatus Brachybacter algidus]
MSVNLQSASDPPSKDTGNYLLQRLSCLPMALAADEQAVGYRKFIS